ncbi:MAG TPA: hypothetical protein VFY84_19330 [Jiangellales bacterium]|nr:hypothetical protein [Jiangellales bacterium]
MNTRTREISTVVQLSPAPAGCRLGMDVLVLLPIQRQRRHLLQRMNRPATHTKFDEPWKEGD